MATWEKILVGALAVGLVFLLWPTVKRGMQQGSKGTSSDWLHLAGIIGIVVLFVLLLIALV